MTVVGSLEDLSFPDILQVVHVSRQSGTLVLTGPQGERRVRFRNGLVCGATLGDRGPELEDLLVQKRLVQPEALRKASVLSQRTGMPLPTTLVEQGAVSQETIEHLVREELRAILRSLVLLQEGEFRFELDVTEPRPGREIGIREGLGPEMILQGLPARGVTGAVRAHRPPGPRPQRTRHVVLVVERSMLRAALADELVRRGFEVEAGNAPAPALARLRALSGSGTGCALVCDLLLPEAAGPGLCGGLDLVARARQACPGLIAIVIGDPREPAVYEKAGAAGAAGYMPLPDLMGASLSDIGPRIAGFCGEVRQVLENPARLEGRRETGGSVRAVDQLSLLRGLIGEMRDEEAGEIPLLVLRLAAEYFDRGVLFAVRDGEACGSGAFGDEPGAPGAGGLDGRIRGVALALERGSVLEQAVEKRLPYVGPIAPTRPNAPLLERLGDPPPSEAVLLPLLSGRHVFGILYGDNARTGRRIGDLKALEIFLSQAGMALENVFLQRRIASLGGAVGGGSGGGRRSPRDG